MDGRKEKSLKKQGNIYAPTVFIKQDTLLDEHNYRRVCNKHNEEKVQRSCRTE